MPIPIRQNTASQEIPLGYFLDSGNGDDEETSLTIANTDIKLWKHGATTLANKNSGGATHISNGVYYCTLDATDSNTLGGLVIFVHVAGALATKVECEVMTANRFDSLVLGTDTLHADVTQWLGTAAATPTVAGVPETDMTHLGGVAQSATDLKDFADAGYDPATNKVQGVVLTDTCTTNTDASMLVSTTVATVTSQTSLSLAGTTVSEDSYNNQTVVIYDTSNTDNPSVRICTDYVPEFNRIVLDSAPDFTVVVGDKIKIFAANTAALPTAVEIRTEMDDNSTKLSDIETDTGEIGTAGAGLTDLGGMSTGMMAEVESEANDALVALKLDHLIAVADADDVVDNSIIAKMAASGATADWSTFINTTESLQAIRDRGDAEWISATGFSTHNAADVKTAIEAAGSHLALILDDTGTAGVAVATASKTGYALSSTGADLILKDSTFALAMADAIWDEVLTGALHNIVNSAGRRVREIGAYAIESGTAQDGALHSITLAATASATDGAYNRNMIILTDNTGVGQTRTIVDYNGTTKVAIIDRDWRTTPDATSTYQVTPDNTALVVDQGVAQAGTATTIKLRAYASAVDDTYLCNIIAIIAGTGRGQTRLVGSYDGTSKIVTICGDNWVTTPDATSVYAMMPYGTTCTSCIGTHALGLINTECDTAITDMDRTGFSLSDAGVDAILDEIIEGTHSMRGMMRLFAAMLVGKADGGGTATITFRDIDDTKDRIVLTVTEVGNRTAVVLTED